MDTLAETVEYKGLTIELHYDHDAGSPREDWDNDTRMVCWHSRYNLGDEHSHSDPHSFWTFLVSECDLTDDQARRIVLAAIQQDEYTREQYIEDTLYARKCHDKYTMKEARVNFVANRIYGEDWEDDVMEVIRGVVLEHYFVLPLYLFDHSGISMSTSSFSCPWDSGQVGYIYISKKKAKEVFMTEENLEERALKLLRCDVEVYDQYLTGDIYGFIIKDEEGNELDSCWGHYGDEYAMEEAKAAADHFAKFENCPTYDI